MRIVLTKKEYINKLFVHALYYWWMGDKFNARNALAVAVTLVKELGHDDAVGQAEETRIRKREDAKIFAIDFPTKRVASKAE